MTLNSAVWYMRYGLDPSRPRLEAPIHPLDVLYERMLHPHPGIVDPATNRCINGDVNQGLHALQAAAYAIKQNWDDEVITAALLHDFGKVISYPKHSYFGAEMARPYVSERTYELIRLHFDVLGVEGSASTLDIFREGNFTDRINLDLKALKAHRWYEAIEQVRTCDDNARDPVACPDIRAELYKVFERTFRLSKEGLGYDGSSASELWKILIEPAWIT